MGGGVSKPQKTQHMKRFCFFSLWIVLSHLGVAQSSFEVKVAGQGIPVLLLPGFTCPGEVWNATVANLDGAFQTHQFTYAGFGGVPEIELPWYATLVDDLSAYIEANQLDNLILVGHSMGGMLAIDIAARLPKRVHKMILVDALPNIREVMMPGVTEDQIMFDSTYNNQMLAASDSAMKVTAGYMAMGMSNETQHHSELIDYILQADRLTYVYGFTELLKLDLKDKLDQLPMETLILGADFPSKEAVMPNFRAQFANLKNKEIKIASNSKHFIMFDQPDWFYREVNNFLD